MVKNYYQLGYKILLVSGREDVYQPQTEKWLARLNISYTELIMRKACLLYTSFWEAYRKIEAEAKAEYKELEDRKATAIYFQACQHPALLFKMYEKRPYDRCV